MTRTLSADEPVWWQTSLCNGMGCTFLGPLLPALIGNWHLRDQQAGLLPSSVFLGSVIGTLLLSISLRRTLVLGSWTAACSLGLFAFATTTSKGFILGLVLLLIAGFGLGQLMSAINLIVGEASPERRAGRLAMIAAAWCAGAVLSPVMATPLFSTIPTAVRLSLLAMLFLLPYLRTRALTIPVDGRLGAVPDVPRVLLVDSRPVLFYAATFFVYGGIESCVSNWMPLFAMRYHLHTFSGARWISSLFWLGLISARLAMNWLATERRETLLLRVAVPLSAVCMLGLLLAPSARLLLAACALTGCCLGAVFPLILSSAIGSGLGTRAMGVVLASCGLGAAAGPALLGLVSSAHGLRSAMLVPLVGLLVLILLGWAAAGDRRIQGSLRQIECHAASD